MTMLRNPFAELAPTAADHFRLRFYGAVLHLRERLRDLPHDVLPFLAPYDDELAIGGVDDVERFDRELERWESRAPLPLPLCELARAGGLDGLALSLLFTIGLPEEDPRFAAVFELVQGSPRRRPTAASLNGWWAGEHDVQHVRASLRRLLELGLVEPVDPSLPRAEHELQPAPLVWDALRGDVHEEIAPWAVYRRPDSLVARADLVVAASVDRALDALPALVGRGETHVLLVRGPQASGRRTLVGTVARELGCGVLEVTGLDLPGDPRWRTVGPLATVLGALPTMAIELAPGETAQLPRLRGCDYPLCVALGRDGGVDGPGADAMLTVTLDVPDSRARLRHWRAELGQRGSVAPELLADRYRMTGGNIRRVARIARAEAALARRDEVDAVDVLRAGRTLHSRVLDTLAQRVPVEGSWQDLAVTDETMQELLLLEARCRHRERLRERADARATSGVRALFTGPSGTGKTLAARLLAAALELDLYRLDLSTVVNKYLGETEKNLSRVFARAEELDVVLLLDEGDALLTRRTDVQTANDRYANLETNYLLQRLESYDGILVVTTNAGDRIDDAFERRMDVVVEFRAPDIAERWSVWDLHLPQAHAVDPSALQEIARRCALTGGQIRNAVLHATLLALEDGGVISTPHVEEAVRREYRKAREVCPLRSRGEAYA